MPMPMTGMRLELGPLDRVRRARIRRVAGASALLVCAVLPRFASAEVGVVSPCPLRPFTTNISVDSPNLPPYPQPVTVTIQVNGVDPERLEARTASSAIDVTLSGRGAAVPEAGGCGSIGISPLPPGQYELSLYVTRDGQAPILATGRTISLGPTVVPPPPPPPPLSPRDEVASTQPVGEIGFQHSVSLDGAAEVSIPIWAPPGRQGIQPSLALIYSSRASNGPLGVGWSLSGLSII